LAGLIVAVAATTFAISMRRLWVARETAVPPPPPQRDEDPTWINHVADSFRRPWSSRRGIETIDVNSMVLFARAPVEPFATALARHAVDWQKDALGREVVLARQFGFVFRLSGHPWSLFVASLGVEISADDRRDLSRTLDAPIIQYVCSDTMGVIGYELHEAGRTIESFEAESDGVTQFRSEVRDGGVADGGSAYRFVAQFLEDHDAYEPGIEETYFFSDGRVGPTLAPGTRRKVDNPGFFAQIGPAEVHSTPEFERVDYLVFKR
jgi:hypothetical protein